MAVAKINTPVTGTAITSSDTTWVTVAECSVPVADCVYAISEIFLIGKGSTFTISRRVVFKGEHRGVSIGGTLALVGTMTAIVSFATGGVGGAYVTGQARINISGTTLQLQVQPGSSISTEWYGGFTLIVN